MQTFPRLLETWSAERILQVTPLLLLAISGCQANLSSPRMVVLSPDQPSRGAATIRLAGAAVRPDGYAIFLPEQPTPTERTAAQELQLHLRLITGQDFAVLPESQRNSRHGFFVGRCQTYALAETELAALGAEGLIIRTHGPDVQLAGNQRGVLYAVSVFLEEDLGCRWFAADCMRVPTSGVIPLGVIDRRYVPPLENRALDYPEHRDAAFAMRNRLTSANANLDAAHGGKVDYYPFVHSFAALVPPAEHFARHPEYYSLIDGKRTAENAQLCLTNPDVLAVARTTVRAWIKDHPEAQIFSVSQNDNVSYCRCDKCAALAEQEGSQAGPLLHFVNAIAADIARDHPDKIIDTLAYQYTRKPPRHVRPAENVTVRLCSIECCFSHPLDGCPQNRSFLEDLRGWSRICKRLSIWDYVISYSHPLAPWPNLYVLQPNIKTFVAHGVTSIYEESNYFSPGGEMAALRSYIMAKTLWDPAYDTDRAIDEFLAGYYGAAASYLRRYVDLLHRRFRNGQGPHIAIFGTNPRDYLGGEFLPQAHALFAQAREAVRDDPTRLRRVRLAHLGALYMTLFEPPIYDRRGDRLVLASAPPSLEAGREFWDVVAVEGISHYREGGPIEALRKIVPAPGELAIRRLRNRQIEIECVPGFGGRILALIDRRTGRNWLKVYRQSGHMLLSESGSELYSGRTWQSPGWDAPFEVVESSESRIVMRARLANGLELERQVTLAGGSKVRCRDSIRNVSGRPQEATLRIHPAFDIPHPAATRLVLRNAAGEDHHIELPKPADATETTAYRFFRGQDRPAGQWGIVDDVSSDRIAQRVIAGEVDEYFVDMDYVKERLTFELWSPTRTLATGEEIAIEHEYE